MLKSRVNRLTSSMIAGLVLALPAANVTADTFSAGGGWPFILAPTITLKQGNNIEYYANYKLGLDDGFTAGVQWAEIAEIVPPRPRSCWAADGSCDAVARYSLWWR